MGSTRYYTGYAAYGVTLATIALIINKEVTVPYMDEICHIPQAILYLKNQWSEWDPRITTPPGLYILSVFLARVLPFPAVPAHVHSHPTILRLTNLLLSLPLPYIYSSILDLLRSPPSRRPSSKGKQTPSTVVAQRHRHQQNRAEGLVLALFPITAFFSALYYTDIGGLLLVMECWRRGLQGRYGRSALAGAASLWFRQTNVLWVGFVAASCVVRELDRAGETDDPLLSRAEAVDVPISMFSLGFHMIANPLLLAPVVAWYMPVFIGALGFVVWNGGIVLGDKEHHVPVLHFPQVLYFIAFAAAFAAPVMLSPSAVWKAVKGLAGTPQRVAGSLLACVAMWWSIMHYTIAHPFLLADNRHYAFYLWRRVINVHPAARYALAPAYLVAARMLRDQLARSPTLTLLPTLLFGAITAVSLVPTPLLEPRYFIVPYLVMRLHFPPPSRARLVAEAAVYAAVLAGTVEVFVRRTFLWEGDEGEGVVARFMW